MQVYSVKDRLSSRISADSNTVGSQVAVHIETHSVLVGAPIPVTV